MRVRPLITIAAIIAACGDINVAPIHQSFVAPELIEGTVLSYVDEFYRVCPKAPRVRFVALVSRLPDDAAPGAVGRSTLTSSSGEGAVYLKLDTWLTLRDNQRRWLVWHELMHAALGVKHEGEGFMKGDGTSIARADEFTVGDLQRYCPPQ